jgi:hypothetical protein
LLSVAGEAVATQTLAVAVLVDIWLLLMFTYQQERRP